MIAFQTSSESRDREEVSYWLQLRPHLQGTHLINGVLYRPKWLEMAGYDKELYDAMIETGIDLIVGHIKQHRKHPQGADVKSNHSRNISEANIIGEQNDRHI